MINKDVEPRPIDGALEKLLWMNRVRQLAGYSKPITLNGNRLVLIALFLIYKLVGGSNRFDKKNNYYLKTVRDMVAIVLFRIVLDKGSFWKLYPTFRTALNQAYKNLKGTDLIYPDITAHIRTTDKETALIKSFLLARSLMLYGLAAQVLIDRYYSGLPCDQTVKWITFLLEEIGEKDASIKYFQAGPSTIGQYDCHGDSKSLKKSAPKGALKFAVLMTTTFDSAIFRSSLMSLIFSDFEGEIVVVEDGMTTTRECEAFCANLPVVYVKNPEWTGPSQSANLAIRALTEEPDILISTHNDVLWPPSWFGRLQYAWDTVYELDKVSMINLAYIEMQSWLDAALSECFVNGSYQNLMDVLMSGAISQSVRDGGVATALLKDGGKLFGLSRDLWNDRPNRLRRMAGRFSVASSYTMQSWVDIGGFEPEFGVGLDWELIYHSLQNRQWPLWINNSPLIHQRSSDTVQLERMYREPLKQMNVRTYAGIPEKYGWELDHLLYVFFAETCVIYEDDITDSVNDLRFSDIDYLFDDFNNRLSNRRLGNCEITWCNSRATCKYQ